MRCCLRKNWLIVVTVISLALNVIAWFLLYQDSQNPADNREKAFIKRRPLNYEDFMDQWGKAWLGLEVTNVTAEIAGRAALDRAEGACVTSVAAGSPAQKGGYHPGRCNTFF